MTCCGGSQSLFTCSSLGGTRAPALQTTHMKVGFEINVQLTLENQSLITKNLPITLYPLDVAVEVLRRWGEGEKNTFFGIVGTISTLKKKKKKERKFGK